MTKKRILVIGDSCRDVYTYCEASRLAPDRPVPVLEPVRVDKMPGMAMNVYKNLIKMTPESGVDIVTNSNWKSIRKERFVDSKSNHMFVRVDHSEEVERCDVSQLNLDYDCIVISDYDKGFLTESDIDEICRKHDNVILDTKKQLGVWATDATWIKINQHEYERSEVFIRRYMPNNIIKTLGGDGCEYGGEVYPVLKKKQVIDVSGAGDTFLAAFVVRWCQDKDVVGAIKVANHMSSKVVSKRGTSTP